jgi:hypothetical protein
MAAPAPRLSLDGRPDLRMLAARRSPQFVHLRQPTTSERHLPPARRGKERSGSAPAARRSHLMLSHKCASSARPADHGGAGSGGAFRANSRIFAASARSRSDKHAGTCWRVSRALGHDALPARRLRKCKNVARGATADAGKDSALALRAMITARCQTATRRCAPAGSLPPPIRLLATERLFAHRADSATYTTGIALMSVHGTNLWGEKS